MTLKYFKDFARIECHVHTSQKEFMRKFARYLHKKKVLKRNSITELIVVATEQLAKTRNYK